MLALFRIALSGALLLQNFLGPCADGELIKVVSGASGSGLFHTVEPGSKLQYSELVC